MTTERADEEESDFPHGIGNPARNALLAVGYRRLEQLTELSEAEILKLHGVGPKAVGVLRQALESKGLSFAPGQTGKK